jgi:DNA replication protein DnaC
LAGCFGGKSLQREAAMERQIQESEERKRQQLVWENRRRLGRCLGPRYREALVSLERYEIYHRSQQTVIERLRSLSIDELIQDGRGIVFWGTVGTGKDYLLAALLFQAAAQATSGMYTSWLSGADFFAARRPNPDEEVVRRVQLAKPESVNILGLSDPTPPAGDLSDWSIAQFQQLVDLRYRWKRPTWLTLNAVDFGDIGKKLSTPVFDRLQQDAEFFECKWPSYRGRRR